MRYAPHKLYKRVGEETRDEYGRITSTGESYEYLSDCRCDDNSDQKFVDDNGKVFIPSYHIVANGHVSGVKAGDYVVVLDGDSRRGEGVVYTHKHLNKLMYTDIWV